MAWIESKLQIAIIMSRVRQPIFRTDGMFIVVFERPEKRIEVNGTVNGIKEDVLNILKQQEGFSARELAKKISKSLRTTMRYIDILKRAGLIEFRGAPKTGGYYLIK